MSLNTYPCPICKKPSTLAPSNVFRPFCSERCKMIDLGEWADERYKVAGKLMTDDSENE